MVKKTRPINITDPTTNSVNVSQAMFEKSEESKDSVQIKKGQALRRSENSYLQLSVKKTPQSKAEPLYSGTMSPPSLIASNNTLSRKNFETVVKKKRRAMKALSGSVSTPQLYSI